MRTDNYLCLTIAVDISGSLKGSQVDPMAVYWTACCYWRQGSRWQWLAEMCVVDDVLTLYCSLEELEGSPG